MRTTEVSPIDERNASALLSAGRPRRGGRGFREALAGYAFVGPGFILFLLLVFAPIIATFVLSFTKSDFFSTEWIGFDNYIAIIEDPDLIRGFLNTVLYGLLIIPAGLLVSLVIALLLSPLIPALQSVFRGLFYLPAVIGGVVMSVVWIWIFDPAIGPLTYLVSFFGGRPPVWLGDPITAPLAVAVVVFTFTIGQLIVVFLAGVNDIPRELQEAAAIDGASRLQVAIHVTIPMLRPVIAFAATIQTIGVLQLWEVIFVLTAGGPDGASTSVVFEIYQQAFQFGRNGMASALGVGLLALTAIAIAVQLRLWRRAE